MAADITWASPTTISVSTLVNSSDPQVVMDPSGNVTAAWVENNAIIANTLPVNGSWGVPTTLSSGSSSSPRLGCDSSGNVTAIWLEGGIVKSRTRSLGIWGLAVNVSGSNASSPCLSVNGSGNAVAVWVRGGFIESATKLIAGLWSLVSVISPTNSDNPHVSVGEGGTVVAVWRTILAGGSSTVESARQTAIGGVWGAAVNILPAPSAYSMNYPKVSVDANGNADVIWYRYLVTGSLINNVFVYAASLPLSSSSWSFPLQISSTGIRNPADLSATIGTDSLGNKVAVWSMSYDNATFGIESACKSPSGSWSDVSSFIPTLYSFKGDLAINTLNDVVTAYMLFDGSNVILNATETSTAPLTFQPSWSTELTISSGSNNAYVRTASAFNGTTVYAAAVWLQSNGTNTFVNVATGSRVPLAPPTNVSVTQNATNYGVFTDYYNTLTWTASISPSVVAYVIYRNGAIYSTVNTLTSQVVFHNEIQNGAVTYGVAAVDSDISQSQTVTVNFP